MGRHDSARTVLCWGGMGQRIADWPRVVGMALVRITAAWGELGAEATWDNGLLAEVIAMGMELQGIAWRADRTDTIEALEQLRAVASRGEQYKRADEDMETWWPSCAPGWRAASWKIR